MIAQSYTIAPTLMAATTLPDLSEAIIQQRAREAPRAQGARIVAEGLSELAYQDTGLRRGAAPALAAAELTFDRPSM